MGVAIGFTEVPSVSSDFRDAADEDRLTTEILCSELTIDGGYIDSLNNKLLRAHINVDENRCLEAFEIELTP